MSTYAIFFAHQLSQTWGRKSKKRVTLLFLWVTWLQRNLTFFFFCLQPIHSSFSCAHTLISFHEGSRTGEQVHRRLKKLEKKRKFRAPCHNEQNKPWPALVTRASIREGPSLESLQCFIAFFVLLCSCLLFTSFRYQILNANRTAPYANMEDKPNYRPICSLLK